MAVRPGYEEWVVRARWGDERAWAGLYAEFRANVYGAARRQGLEPADAEDVVELVLGLELPRSLERLAEYRGPAQLARWLERQAAREAQNLRRRRHVLLLREAAQSGDVTSPRYPLVEHALQIGEQLAWVRRHLTEAQWTTLQLRDLEGLSYPQIADRLATTEEVVRKRLYRARARLRSLRGGPHAL